MTETNPSGNLPQDPPNNPPSNPPAPNQYEGWVSPVELETLLRKVRKEEKDKLYAEIEKLQGDNKTATENLQRFQTQVQELQSKLTDVASAKTEIESLKSQIAELTKNGGTQVNNQPPVNPVNVQPQPNPEVEALRKELAEVTALVKSQTEMVQKAQAEESRKKFVAEKAGSLYPEIQSMIQGNTPEELEASLQRATQLQQSIYQRASKDAVNIPPANPQGEMNLGELTPDKIQQMTPAEWAEARKNIKFLGAQ